MNKKKNILPSTIGTVLEYYDFTLYGAFAPIIATYYFSEEQKSNLVLVTYFLSFLVRPIGALIFGYIGDIYGRKNAFGMPLILMAVFTLGIAFIPPYESIGIISSVLLIICRLGQGLCLGGEFGGAIVFGLEHNKKNLGIVSGLIGGAVLFGSFLGNFISYILTLDFLPNDLNLWKGAFILGAVIGLIGIWVRNKAYETPEFISISKKQSFPILIISKNYKLPFIKAIVCSGLNGFLGSFSFVYINFFLVNNLNWPINLSLFIILLGHSIALLVALITGYLVQKIKPEKLIILCCCYLIIIIIPILLALKNNEFFMIVISMITISIATGIGWGSVNLFLYKLFLPEIRYTGVAVGDSLGRIIFSAPVPLICNIIFTNFGLLYISGMVFIFCLIIVILLTIFVNNSLGIK